MVEEILEVKKKDNRKIVVGIVLVILVIGWYLLYTGKIKMPTIEEIEEETPIPPGTSEGGLELSACVSDEFGNCLSIMSNRLQLGGRAPRLGFLSTITIEGIPKFYNATYIKINSTLTKSGTVPSVNVTNVAGSPIQYQTAINKGMTKSFTLGTTPNKQSVIVNTSGMAYNTPITWTSFQMDVTANYKSATGVATTISPTPSATLNVRLMPDECEDGTDWNQCSATPGTYCHVGTTGQEGAGGQPGYLVTDCRGPNGVIGGGDDCPCGIGKTCEADGTCSVDACTGGTVVGQCVSPAPTGNIYANPNANKRFCATDGAALIEDCSGADTTAGNGDDCGCALDYYNSAGTCNGVTGVCSYTTYTGGINVSIAG